MVVAKREVLAQLSRLPIRAQLRRRLSCTQSEKETLIASAIDAAKSLIAKGVNVNDIAFLVMTNSEGAMVEEACTQAGIETILQTSSSLGKLSSIASIVSFVRYLVNKEEIDKLPLFFRCEVDALDLSWFTYALEPIVVIDRIVRDFKIACDDNLLRLLDFASAYHDLKKCSSLHQQNLVYAKQERHL
ncbi:MAG: hypothetical protein P8Y43_03790 [Sulfurovaceae bacterium]